MSRQGTVTKNGNGQSSLIGFTAKELFFEINRKLDLLSNKNDMKAEKQQVDTLATLVTEMQRRGSDPSQQSTKDIVALENRINIVERESATVTAVNANNRSIQEQDSTSRKQWIAIVITALGAIAGIVLHLLKL